MKKLTTKNVLAIAALPLILLIVFFGAIIHYVTLPYFETIYTPHYSEEKFSQIKIGMTTAQVQTLAGEPLEKNETDYLPEKIWRYSKSDKKDPNYFVRNIRFKNDLVDSIEKWTFRD